LEKDRQEFDERLWAVDLDAKRSREKEKALNDKILQLMAKNESLQAEITLMKDQARELNIENVKLQNSLAQANTLTVAARPATTSQPSSLSVSQLQTPAPQPKQEDVAEVTQPLEVSRQTRSQTRTQDQQARELLLSKPRSRPSYLPKPSSRKPDVLTVSQLGEKIPNGDGNNKENSKNNNVEEPIEPARRQRASMIPIRRGSSLAPQQIKALRG
jgi:hypothetical protein